MKHRPTEQQIIDALQKFKTLYSAAYSFRVSPPTLKRWMNYYGIVANRLVKQEPTTQRLPWYKRMFAKRNPVPSGQ